MNTLGRIGLVVLCALAVCAAIAGSRAPAPAFAAVPVAAATELAATVGAFSAARDHASRTPVAGGAAVTRDAPASARPGRPAAGAIEGRVVLEQKAPRRVTSRYAGGPPVVRTVEPVPAVVFVHGDLGAAEPPASPPRVAQADTMFRPPVVIVPVGAAVEFPNEDPFFHNVFSFSRAKRFDLGRYPEGESKSVVFEEPGVVEVYCEVHKWMRAAVVVVENGYYATVSDDGRFRIGGVPAGRHRLTVWEFDHGEATVEVDVPSDGVARVEVEL